MNGLSASSVSPASADQRVFGLHNRQHAFAERMDPFVSDPASAYAFAHAEFQAPANVAFCFVSDANQITSNFLSRTPGTKKVDVGIGFGVPLARV